MLWALSHSKDLIDGSYSNFLHLSLQVSLLEILNRVEESLGSIVEVDLSVELGVGEEVHKCSLFDRFVLSIDAVVLKLLLGVSQVLILHHLALIGPLVAELAVLVVSVHIIEHGELWTNEVSEMTDFNQTNIEGNEELMMPDHCTKPVVVFPTAKSRHCVD